MRKYMLSAKFTNSKYAKIDYSKMVAAAVSNYSSETPYHMHQLLKIIDSTTPKARMAIDATAHIGGFSLVYAKVHPKCKITSIEINPEAYSALNRNMYALYINNIYPVLGDSSNNLAKCDFIYVDPPWGGPDYRNFAKIDLSVGKLTSKQFVALALQYAPVVYMKVPNNYDFSLLDRFRVKRYDIMGENPKKTVPDYVLLCISTKSVKAS